MKQVAEELTLTSVDIFNIVASPTISYLSEDVTELSRLILNYGIPRTTDDDAERGGEKSAVPVWKIEAEKSPVSSNAESPILVKRHTLSGPITDLKDRNNAGTLNTQFQMEKQRAKDEKIKKSLAKELCERYDRTFMSKDNR